MSKLEKLLGGVGANIDASMGAGREARPLHGATTSAAASNARMQGVTRSKDAAEIPVDRIAPDPDQPREEFEPESLARLAESLKTRGQLQPIRVRWDEAKGAYMLVMGERRWRAARMAGLNTLSCVIMEAPADPSELLALQMIENCVREDLRPVEQAKAYRSLISARGWSARQLAAELAINPATVTRALALLELPEAIQGQVEQGILAPHTAYEVSKLDTAEEQTTVAAAVVEQGLTRSEVVDVIKAVRAKRPVPASRPEPITLDLGDGCVVVVKWRKAGGPSAIQALRRAMKLVQDRDRGEVAA
jgi:ParB family transcriptional regulator, chromosome partitioning protein